MLGFDGGTYKWKLGYYHRQDSQEVDRKISEVVVGVVCAEQKQNDRHAKQKLLRRRVLVSVVDLLPHIQVVVSSRVELERDAANPMEHEVGAKHI